MCVNLIDFLDKDGGLMEVLSDDTTLSKKVDQLPLLPSNALTNLTYHLNKIRARTNQDIWTGQVIQRYIPDISCTSDNWLKAKGNKIILINYDNLSKELYIIKPNYI